MAAIRIPRPRTRHFVETVQDQEVGGEGAAQVSRPLSTEDRNWRGSRMTATETLLLTFAATIIGSGLGTTIVAALFKKRFDTQLETHKDLLQRGGRIHERQVDALLPLHSKLQEALSYLQGAAGAGKFAGQASDKELLERMGLSLRDAYAEFSKNKLLLSESLEQKLNKFFSKMLSGEMTVSLALDPMVPNGDPRAKLWDEARETAYKELPTILKAISDEARAVIHG